MGECRHHLPREPAIPALSLSSPDLVAVLTQMIWWDEINTMNLPSAHSKARHELGPPFQTLLDFSGRNLHVLASTLPDADAIIHALASLIQSQSSTLTSISIPLSPSFACSSLIPLLVAALPHLGFSPGKPTIFSALATCAYQKIGKLPPSVHLTEVTAPEDLAVKIAIESTLFRLPPSYADRLQPALDYMTYGTAQARDRHFLAWYASPQGAAEREAVAYLTLRVGRGVAYVQGAGVLEPWRRQGIVRAMLDRAIDVAIELGYAVVATSAWTEEAAAAWTAMGFQDVGEYTEWTWTNTADREKLTGLHN